MLSESSKLNGAGRYGGARVYVPSGITKDSQFTKIFEVGGDVEIRLDPDKGVLEVRPAKNHSKK